jgi:hypothetical protein
MIDKFHNPFEISIEQKILHTTLVLTILSKGAELWVGEKEKTPVSLEIPHEAINCIEDVCRESGLNQWEFESKLFSSLVLDGMLYRSIRIISPKTHRAIMSDMNNLVNSIKAKSEELKTEVKEEDQR